MLSPDLGYLTQDANISNEKVRQLRENQYKLKKSRNVLYFCREFIFSMFAFLSYLFFYGK